VGNQFSLTKDKNVLAMQFIFLLSILFLIDYAIYDIAAGVRGLVREISSFASCRIPDDGISAYGGPVDLIR